MSSAAVALNEITPGELDDLITENTSLNEIRTNNTTETIFSPMNFMQCERGIGRPKKKRFGAPSALKTKRNVVEDMNTNNAEEESKKRGRGRPKGSKNKQRDEPATKKRKTEKSLRQRAEQAAYGDLEEEESCQICQFKFSDSIQKDKQVAVHLMTASL